jgi:ribosome maturation factor RimP
VDSTDGTAFEARFVAETGLAAQIADLAEPVLAALGFRLVRVTISGRDGMTLQVMAERANGVITVEDCAAISRQLSPLLDARDPLPGRYRLEVSSPGIDRPLVRPSDFRDWTGHAAKIELQEAIAGRKRFTGVIEGVQGGEVKILERDGGRSIGLELARIAEARLLLTDDLIRETLRRAKRQSAAGAAAEDAAQ